MAQQALFISISDIKDRGYVEGNVDDVTIRKAVLEAQQLHILPILGTALYDKLNTDILASTVVSPYTTLLTKLRDALIWATMYELVYPLSIKMRNKGTMQQAGDNTSNMTLGELHSIMDDFQRKRDEYSQRLTNYLVENEASFSEYRNPGSGADTIHPDRQNYTTTWYLESGGSGCRMIGGPDSTIDI